MTQHAAFRFHALEAGREHSLKGVMLTLAFLLVAGVVGVGIIGGEFVTRARLGADGVVTRAAVVDKTFVNGVRDRNDGYYITYEFTVPERDGDLYPFRARRGVSAETFYATGSTIEIIYDPEDPDTSRTLSARLDAGFILFGVLGLLIFGGFAAGSSWLLWRVVRGIHNEKRLDAEGQSLPGRVLVASAASDSQQNYRVNVSYEFVNPQGTKLLGSYHALRNDLRGIPLPEKDATIVVRYLNDGVHALA